MEGRVIPRLTPTAATRFRWWAAGGRPHMPRCVGGLASTAMEVSDRGAISAEVVEAYEAAR